MRKKPYRGKRLRRDNHWSVRGLVAAYGMNEGMGTHLNDLSGNRHHGTMTDMDPATDWVAGRDGWALDFDGDNDYVEIGYKPELDNPANFTFVVSINSAIAGSAYSDYGHIVNIGDFYSRGAGILVSPLTDKIQAYYSYGASTDNKILDATSALNIGILYQIVLVRDSAGGRLYVNGNLEDSNTESGGNWIDNPLRIGAQSKSVARFFNGIISEVHMYNRALSAGEIAEVYRNPYAMFAVPERAWLVSVGAQYEDSLSDSMTPTEALTEAAGKLLSDSMTPTEALTESAGKALSDSMTPTEALIESAGKALSDSMTPTEALTEAAGKALSDSMTPTEALIEAASKALSDSMTPTEALTEAAGKLLSDSMTPTEALIEAAGKGIADSMTGADLLSAILAGAVQVADSMVGADAIQEDAAVGISDVMTAIDLISGFSGGQMQLCDSIVGADAVEVEATIPIQDAMTAADVLTGVVGGVVIALSDQMVAIDVLTGVLGLGILPALANKVTTPVASRRKQPSQGTKLVTNRPSPITSVTTSSTSTTFTDTSVQDSNAWNVSDVDIGDVVVTADEHMGFVTGTGLNTVNVEEWILRGVKPISSPDDGQSVTVHKRLEAGSVLLCALTTNTVTVYVGFDSEVSPVNGHPLSFGSGDVNRSIVLYAPAGKVLNLSDVWVIAGKDQYLRWQTDSEHAPMLLGLG